MIWRWIFGLFELVVVEEMGVVGTLGKASAAAALSAKKRSNSDDVKDSWSPCAPGWKIYTMLIIYLRLHSQNEKKSGKFY